MKGKFNIFTNNFFPENKYVMFCAIWYHLYNLNNVKTTHGGVFSLQFY